MKPGPTGTITLPHWLQMIFVTIAEAPWTNLKQLNALIMDWATAFFLALAAILGYKIEEPLVYAWLAFLSGLNGFALAAAGWKRSTYKPSPPYGPDIEDAQAGATATPVKPGVPQAGVKPRDPAIIAGVEALAANQQLRDADGLPFKGVPDDAPKSDETGGLG